MALADLNILPLEHMPGGDAGKKKSRADKKAEKEAKKAEAPPAPAATAAAGVLAL